MSKKTWSTIIQLVAFLGLGIGLMIWRYNAISPENKADMFAAFRDIRWLWIIPLMVVGFFAHFFRALRWKLFMRPLNIYPTTVNTAFAVFIGYLANALVPRLGEVAKCTVLGKYDKVPVDKVIGTMVAERIWDTVCLVILMVATLFLQYDVIYPYAKGLGEKIFLNDAGQIKWLHFGILLFILLAGIIFILWLARRLKGSKVGNFIKGMGDGLKSIGKIKEKGWFLLYTVLIWGAYTVLILFAFFAMPQMADTTLMASLAILTFGSIGMIVSPGGIGAYPVIVTEVLLLYGVNSGVGFAFGWVAWGGQTLIVIVYGLLSLLLLPIYNRKRENDKQTKNYRTKDNDTGKVEASY